MAYNDPPTPANLGRFPQGQRCASCGHLEPDNYARFCGVCGSTLAAGGAPAVGPTPIPGASREPPIRYGTVAPPNQHHAPSPAPYAPPASFAGQAEAPQPVIYTIPSVGFGAPARIGAAVAAGFTLVPCVLFAFLGSWLVHEARDLIGSWQSATVPIPIPLVTASLSMNFIDLLHMRPIYNDLIYWDDHLGLAFAILWLVPWLLWILAGAFFGVLLAVIYNIIGKMGGGIRMTMVPVATSSGRPVGAAGRLVVGAAGRVGGAAPPAAPMTADDRAYGTQLGEVLRQRSVPALRAFLEAQAARYGGEAQAEAIRAQSDVELELILHRMILARADLSALHPESERWLAAQGGPGSGAERRPDPRPPGGRPAVGRARAAPPRRQRPPQS